MIIRKHIPLIVLVSLFLGCANQASRMEPSPERIEVAVSPVGQVSLPAEETGRFAREILDANGLIVLGDSESRDMLRFYNGDGTVWHEFTFYYDDSDGHFEYEKDNFLPFSFHPDYFTLALRLVDEDAKYYVVVVNEEKSLRKYVKKDDKKFKLVTWERHILGTFAIDFDRRLNPIRQSPNGPVRDIRTVSIDRLGAKSFDGDWLRVEWDVSGSEHDDDERKDSGWIRWRSENILLIDWFYFA